MGTALIKQVQYLKENGFTEQQAHTLIYFQKDSIESTMATKKDIAEVKKDIVAVKRDIEQLRADTKKDIEQLRADTKKDLEMLKKDLILKLGSIIAGSMMLLGVLLGILIQFS